MDRVAIEERGEVALVTLSDGKANTLSTAMTEELAQAATLLDSGRGGVVLTGTGRFFSAGLDLVEVLSMDRDRLGAFVGSFEKMCLDWFTLPRPVVAAVNGHAIAGGTVLALTADSVLCASGEYKLGLTELALGISLPAIVLELVRYHLSPPAVGRIVLEGELFGPEGAKGVGLCKDVVESESLLDSACALAAKLASGPGAAFGNTKADLRREYAARVQANRELGARHFLESFSDPSVRAHIQRTLEKMKKR